MSMESLRSVFIARAEGKLRLGHASLAYQGPAQVLTLTGFHDDGLPFAFTSAPFLTDPVERAGQIAQDIIAAHTGVRPMPAPAAIASLADTLRAALKSATERASAMAPRAQASVANLHSVLDTADGVLSDVDKAAADVQSALGLSTNGGPAGPLEK